MQIVISKWRVIAIALCYLTAITFFIPNFFDSKFLPESKINLGLDLKGGSQLLLKYEFDHYLHDQLKIILAQVRKELRSAKISYQNLKLQNDQITLTVLDQTKFSEASRIISKVFANLNIEKHNNENLTLSYNNSTIVELRKKLKEQTVEIINRRINEHGTIEPIIQPIGDDRIDVQVPGVKSPEHLKVLLGRTAKLEFHLVNENVTNEQFKQNNIPLDSFIASFAEKETNSYNKIILKKEVLMSGSDLADARVSLSQGQPAVVFELTNIGAKKFADITKNNVGHRFAIVLDGQVISAPNINEPIIGGSGIISGSFTIESAAELALLLRAGALPVELKVIEERSIGPSLGADSIQSGKIAGVIAFALVGAFMIARYKILGVMSVIALMLNLITIIALLSLIGASLTMPGIAGIVLTIGMAVDANVLIYERIREELKLGSNVSKAVYLGFNNAFRAILDSNITTLIVALMLYIFGTGAVKGFAVTLSIGILSSMLSSISLTKLMVDYRLKHNSKNLSI